MSSRRNAIVGRLVWHGAKWYVRQQIRSRRTAARRRMPSRRATLLGAAGALSVLVASLVLVRRLAG
ncbi:MAG TPA: hypothetical protein VEJ23_05405 [Solirubrobacteraceae bacterium]|nr:hypothetical protein [Solirubrobacteraceae bacterium]